MMPDLVIALIALAVFALWFRWDNKRHNERMDRIYAEHFPGIDRHKRH